MSCHSTGLAVLYKLDREQRINDRELKRLTMAGWSAVDETFATTTAGTEVWQWKLFSVAVKKGSVELPPAGGVRGDQLLFIFK